MQERDRPPLVERLVPVAALRGLHAGRAPVLTGAVDEQLQRGGQVFVGHGVAELGDARPASRAVVDHDGRSRSVLEPGGRHAADVPPVTDRVERQDPDGGVLDRVQRAGDGGALDACGTEQPRPDDPPEPSGDEPGGRKLQCLGGQELAGEGVLALVPDDLRRHLERAEAQVEPAHSSFGVGGQHADGRFGAGLGVLVARRRDHDCGAIVEVELHDAIRHAAMEVDRSRVHHLERPSLVDGADKGAVGQDDRNSIDEPLRRPMPWAGKPRPAHTAAHVGSAGSGTAGAT